jgi:hypothetical protein
MVKMRFCSANKNGGSVRSPRFCCGDAGVEADIAATNHAV